MTCGRQPSHDPLPRSRLPCAVAAVAVTASSSAYRIGDVNRRLVKPVPTVLRFEQVAPKSNRSHCRGRGAAAAVRCCRCWPRKSWVVGIAPVYPECGCRERRGSGECHGTEFAPQRQPQFLGVVNRLRRDSALDRGPQRECRFVLVSVTELTVAVLLFHPTTREIPAAARP